MGKNIAGMEIGRGFHQRKDDGRYTARLTDRKGNRHERSFYSLKEAKNWYNEALHDDYLGRVVDGDNITLKTLFTSWIKYCKDLSNNTKRGYNQSYHTHIEPVLCAETPIGQITSQHCQEVLDRMDVESLSHNTIKLARAVLRNMFEYAVDMDILKRNPITKMVKANGKSGKKKEDCRVVVNGAGSAGIAITKLLLTYGFSNVTMCDRNGILHKDYEGLNWMQEEMLKVTNLSNQTGTLADALVGADIFVGVSAPGIVTPEMVKSMNSDSILFAMANPTPEIMPDLAKEAGARIVGTGRSDFPNQVNNVIAFPGIFKGALEGRASIITEEMKLAAATAIASLVSDEELNENFIMPEAFDPRVADVVSEAVKSHIQA